jgi:hypothetical protein
MTHKQSFFYATTEISHTSDTYAQNTFVCFRAKASENNLPSLSWYYFSLLSHKYFKVKIKAIPVEGRGGLCGCEMLTPTKKKLLFSFNFHNAYLN